MKTKFILALGLLGSWLLPGQAIAYDAAKGKQIFARCASCHSDQADVSRIGPSLFGVVGRVPGTLASFKNFSPAMKTFGEGKVWDEVELDGYFANPKTFIPGNRMAFIGVPKADERADLIAYLKTLKGD